jgi:serine/threonine-protein kinase
MGRLIADKYELVSELSTGVLGTVYSARHVLLGTAARVTLLPARLTDHPEEAAAFQAAARAAIRLAHANIVRLLDVGRDRERYYVVEELVEGPDLGSRLATEGALAPSDALALTAQLAGALAYAHDQGVIHGSVQPGVVLLAETAPVRGMLAGFGVDVRWCLAALPPALGAFLAPERLPAPGPPRPVDGRADVFSLGQLLIVSCGGQAGSGSPFGLGIPPALDALVTRATAADPGARFPEMRAFLAAVESVARELAEDTTVVVRPGSIVAPAPPPHRASPAPRGPERPAPAPRPAADDTTSLSRPAIDDDATVVISRLRSAESSRVRYPLREPDGSPAPPPPPAAPAPPRTALGVGAAVGLVVLLVGWYLTRSAPEPVAPPPVASAPIATLPAPPPPLAWARAEPAVAEQTLTVGERLEFEAAVSDTPGRPAARYAWTIDGRAAGDGSRFAYTPPAEAAGTSAEVVVTASAGDGGLERRWRVQVRAQNQPPVLASASPEGEAVSVPAGTEQSFVITASDPDAPADGSLTYVWEENGEERATGPDAAWVLRPTTPGEAEVRVTVRDAAGASAPPRAWKVTVTKPVPNRAPRVVSQKPPAGELAVATGDTVVLSVRGTDPNPDDQVSYRWYVDGREASRAASFRFKAAPPLGATRRVEVELADAAGLKAPRVGWTIQVTPKMTETDARDWVGRLRAAWERKDVATLRLYGIVTSDGDAEAQRRRMRGYREFRVAIGNESVRVKGKYATVSFDRTELDGERALASSRLSYELEKHANGLVTVRGHGQ